MNSTAVMLSYIVTGVIMAAWIVWGIREYRRTGRAQWLWMACLLGVSLLFTLTQLA